MKKLNFKGIISVLSGVVVLSVFPNSSFAATLASYTTTLTTSGEMTGNYNSNGGTYQVCVSGIASGNQVRVQLFEYDPSTGLSEIGSDKYISPSSGCATWTGITVDGDNGLAELNAKLNATSFSDTVTVQLID